MGTGGGGLMQLVAVGAQDAFLTGTPQKSYWRQRYARHTNFAVESIRQVLSGTATYGGRAMCTLARNGDLVTHLMVEVTMRKASSAVFYPPEHFLKRVELEIGGQRVDLLTNTWLRLYDELHRRVDAREAHLQMADFGPEDPVNSVRRFYVQLPFWFCRGDPSTALPLISLQYHEVKLTFDFEDGANIPGIDPSFEPSVAVWADYVFLDAAERRWFASTPQEYLVEQTQEYSQSIDGSKLSQRVDLPFSHPLKYVTWVLMPSAAAHGVFTGSLEGLESREVYGPVDQAVITLNGRERFAARRGSYFRLVHPALTFGQAPSVGVYVYSFALRPADHAPSGTLNASRVDVMRLELVLKRQDLATATTAGTEEQTVAASSALRHMEIYARNYNILRIQSGMAGLAFNN
jgi:hypothetical protein